MPGIEWTSNLDNSGFINSMRQIQDTMRQSSQVLQSFGNSFNIGNVVDQYITLTRVIQENETAIQKSRETVVQWMRNAEEARNKGDFGLFDTTQIDISDKLNDIEQMVVETEEAKKALNELMGIWGNLESQKAPMLFNSQEEYDNVKRLKEEIADLQTKISNFNGSDSDLEALRGQLSSLEEDLRKCEISAAQNAAKLGNAGAMAAEASNHYYELTNQIKEQEIVVGELTIKLNEAEQAYKKALGGNNVQDIMDARAKMDAYAQGLDNARHSLISMKSEQEDFHRKMQQMSKGVSEAGSEIIGVFKNIAAVAGVSFTLSQAKQFVNEVVSIRSAMQDLETSMTIFLGSEEKASAFNEQLKNYSMKSLFHYNELMAVSRQMLALGMDTEQAMKKMDQLANIAAATHASLSTVSGMYQRAQTMGSVMNRQLVTWQNLGVNVKQVLKEMGENVTKSTISFEQLDKVINQVTAPGGKFAHAQEDMLGNISAEIDTYKNKMELMFNEIGEQYQDYIVGAIKGGQWLIENYREIGSVVMDCIAAYGAYRAAILAVAAAHKVSAAWETAAAVAAKLNTTARVAQTGAISTSSVVWSMATKSVMANTTALLRNAAAAITNPYVLLGAAVGALTFGVYKLATADDAETAARKRANEEAKKFADILEERKDKIDSLISTIRDETKTAGQQARAWDELKTVAPSLTEGYTQAEFAAKSLDETQKLLNKDSEDFELEQAREEVEKYRKEVEEAEKVVNKKVGEGLINKIANFFHKKDLDEATALLKDAEEKLQKLEETRNKVFEPKELGDLGFKELLEAYKELPEKIDDINEKKVTLNVDSQAVEDAISWAHGLQSELIAVDVNNVEAKVDKKEIEDAKEEAISALQKIIDLDKSIAEPDVKREKIEDAEKKAKKAIDKLYTLDGMTAMPKVGLLNYDSTLEKLKTLWGYLKKILGINDTGENKKTLTTNGKPSTKADARAIVAQKLANANSDEDINGLKKQVNELKAKAQYGSDERKYYQDVLNQLNQKQKKNNPSSSKTGQNEAKRKAKEEADAQAKSIQQQLKYNDELQKLQDEATDSRTRAEIAAIKDEAERERKEREYQHKKNLEDIASQQDEIYKKIYENRKAAYENAHKNDKDGGKYENTAEGTAGWEGVQIETLKGVQDIEHAIIEEFVDGDIIKAVQEQFGKGNVDVIARPMIDAAELVKKGWKDAGKGIATVFSSQYGIKDSQGNVRELLVTPILPDGRVLSEKELTDYLDNTLEGAEDILAADTKGIVISVGEIGFKGDLGGDALHKLQAQLLNLPTEKLAQIQQLYKNLNDTPEFTSIRNLMKDLSNVDASQLNSIYETINKIDLSSLGKQGELLKETWKDIFAKAAENNEKTKTEEQERIDSLIKQYQSYTDRRIEIEKEYKDAVSVINNEISKLQTKLLDQNITDEERTRIEGQIAALTRSLGEAAKKSMKELSDVAKSELQNSPLFSLAWKDLSRVSSETLNMLIDKFKEYESEFAKDPQAMKEWQERIKAMTNEIVSRNPFKAIAESRKDYVNALKKREVAQLEMKELTEKKRTLEERKKLIEEEIRLTEIDLKVQKARGIDTTDRELALAEAKQKLIGVNKEIENTEQKLTKVAQEYADAENEAADAINRRKEAQQEIMGVVSKLSSAIKELGNTIGGTSGDILNLIGDVMDFANTLFDGIQQISEITASSVTDVVEATQKGVEATAEAVQKTSSATSKALSAMEKASVILLIISAAIKLIQKLSEIIPDSFGQYEKYRDKVSSINMMEQAVRDYEMAVLEARNAEQSWFASSGMRDLSNQWLISNKAAEDYFKKLHELQATYQNESRGGWSAVAYWLTPTAWTEAATDALGISKRFVEPLGMALGDYAGVIHSLQGVKEDEMTYVEGMTEAWKNLRIETREASSGFLGSGLFGHTQETENLVTWVKDNLGLDLFDEEGWIDLDVYDQIMEKYSDKLVGETEETLKTLAELKEKHDEFLNQLHDYVNEMYAPVMTNFVDAMWEWFDEGKDALDAFRDAASDTFRNIVSDLLQTQMLKLFGQEMSDTITQLYEDYFDKGTISYGELMSGVTDAVGLAATKFEEAQPVLQATMTAVADGLDGIGINIRGLGETASTVFDDMNTAFRNSLLGMEYDAQTFSDDIVRIFTEALLNKFVFGEEYEKQLEEMAKKTQNVLNATHKLDNGDGTFTYFTDEEFNDYINSYKNQINGIDSFLSGLYDKLARHNQIITEQVRKESAERRKLIEEQYKNGQISAEEYGKQISGLYEWENQRILELQKNNTEYQHTLFQINDAIEKREKIEQQIADLENMSEITEEERAERIKQLQEDYLKYAEELREKSEQLKKITGLDIIEAIEASGLADIGQQLLNMLNDTTKGVEEWKNDVVKIMTEDLIKETVYNDDFKAKMREIQEMYVAVLQGDTEKMEGFGLGQFIHDGVIDTQAALKYIAELLAGVAAEAKETADSINESMGNIVDDTTFKDMSDSFVSSLMDMNKSAEDWAQDIGRTMAQKIIEEMIVPTMIQPLLDNLQEVFNSVMDSAIYTDDEGRKQYDWEKVINSSELTEALNMLSEKYPEIQGVVKQIMEALHIDISTDNDNPFSDMASTFISSLTDMEANARTFANDISRMFTEQMIEKTVKDLFQDEIDELGEQYREALEAGDMEAVEAIKQALIELRERMGEALDPLLERIEDIERQSDTTFTDMKDSWVSALMDMEGTAEDWAQNVGKTMAQKIITELIAPVYLAPLLEAMQIAFNEALAMPGATIASVIAAMSPYIEEMKDVFDELHPIIEEMFHSLGIFTEEVADAVEESVDEIEYALQDLKSNFVSALMDMENSAEDFSKDISKIIAQSFIEKFVLGDAFDARMKQWQEQYERILSSGLSEDERKKQLKALRDAIAAAKDEYVDSAMAVQELLGLTTADSQEATMNMADKITYDQAEELLGINLAQELTLEQILAVLRGTPITTMSTPISSDSLGGFSDKYQSDLIANTLMNMANIYRVNSDNILLQVAIANSHLEQIHGYSKKMYDVIDAHMESIDTKLTNLNRL